MNAFERLDADFAGTGVTTGRHPMALIRKRLPERDLASDLPQSPKWTRRSHRRTGHLPSAPRHRERIRLHQPRR